MNPNIPPEIPGDETTRNMTHQVDIMSTQIHPQWQEGNITAEENAADYIIEANELLAQSGDTPQSKAELNYLLQKIDAAIAITNEPHARKLRQHLLARFGDKE